MDRIVSILEDDTSLERWNSKRKLAILALLRIPEEVQIFTQQLRERVIKVLLTLGGSNEDSTATLMDITDWKSVLSLMVKVTREPMFYKVCNSVLRRA